MNRPSAYSGSEPYIFISYAHKDAKKVLPIIAGLQERSFRVWYDEGLEVGSSWGAMIESHLYDCTCVICFVSENFLESENCKDEIAYAKELRRGPLIIYLEDFELPRQFRFSYSRFHALQYSDFSELDHFLDKLCDTSALAPCKEESDDMLFPAYLFHSASRVNTESPQMQYEKGEEYYQRGDYENAVVWYRKGADGGNADAQFSLAECYRYGRGVEANTAKAAQWYREAARQGHEYSKGKLYECYSGNYIEPESQEEFMQWLHWGAEGGHADAQYRLHQYYTSGTTYIQKDPQEALRWLKKAAAQNHVNAVFDLGKHYQYSRIGNKYQYDEAIECFEKAAKMGHPQAQKRLKECRSERFWDSFN